MAVLLSPVYFSPNHPLWLDKNVSSLTLQSLNVSTISVSSIASLNVSSINANTITALSTFVKNIYADYSETTEAFIYDKLSLDNQELTADINSLLLNGVPLATTANLSSIADWSIFAQISTLDGNNQNIIGTNLLQAKTIGVSTIEASNATITTLIGNNATFTNLFTQNLMAFNIVNMISTVIEVYESTIQSDIKLANISTANINNLNTSNAIISTLTASNAIFNTITASIASFDNLTVSSITLPPTEQVSTLNVSTLNTSFLNVGCNANLLNATFSNAPTFNDGGNFNGTRPNFNTGIVTSGPNNFNFTNIDNAGDINGATINVTVGSQTNITADAGDFILGNPAVNLTTQGGGSSAIRIQAKQCSPVAFPIPNSSVDVLAEGNVSYIPIAPVPYGGLITLRAKAGGTNPLTSPLSFQAGNGAIRLTADSYFPFGELYPPVPGVVALSGGAVLSIAGLTTPATSVYGVGIYSALTALSLTCGLTPAVTSYPGTVYISGDNGTKVLNGLYVDTLYNALGYNLNITTQDDTHWVDIRRTQALYMGNNPVIDGGGGTTSQIQNFYNISGSNVNTPQLNVNNISTGAFTLPQLYTSHISIAPTDTVFITNPDLTINANLTTAEGEEAQPNNLNLFASSNINIQAITNGNVNIQCANNPIYSVNITGETYVSKTLYAPKLSTMNLNVSSINNSVYPPSSSIPNALNVSSIFTSTIQTPYASISSINNVSSINGSAYPPSSSIPSVLGVSALTTSTINVASNTTTPIIQGTGAGYTWTVVPTSVSTTYTAITKNDTFYGYYACASNDYIYFYDGFTTTQQATIQNWSGIASFNLSFTKASACVYGGGIWITTDTGTTWTLTSAPTAQWTCITEYNNTGSPSAYIAFSTDQGAYYTANGITWTQITGSTGISWSAVSRMTGTILAVANPGKIYSVTNTAVTVISACPIGAWVSVACYTTLDNTGTSYQSAYLGRIDGSGSYRYNGFTGTFTATTGKGYVGVNNYGGLVIYALPGNRLTYSINGGALLTSSSPIANWSCININGNSFTGITSPYNPYISVAANSGQVYQLTGNFNAYGNLIVQAPDYVLIQADGATTATTDATGNITLAGTVRSSRSMSYMAPTSASYVRQPFIQSGTASAGSTSPYRQVLTYPYNDTSYVIQLTHKDTTANTILCATPLSPSTFSIAWAGAVGSQSIYWTTFGT